MERRREKSRDRAKHARYTLVPTYRVLKVHTSAYIVDHVMWSFVFEIMSIIVSSDSWFNVSKCYISHGLFCVFIYLFNGKEKTTDGRRD